MRTPIPNDIDLLKLGPCTCSLDAASSGVKVEFTNMEAISARDKMTNPNPVNVQIYDQNTPARPPSISPCVFALGYVSKSPTTEDFSVMTYINRYSQTAVRTTAKLNVENAG